MVPEDFFIYVCIKNKGIKINENKIIHHPCCVSIYDL